MNAPLRLILALGALLVVLLSGAGAPISGTTGDLPPSRAGYMRSVLRNTNENDFQSALRVYSKVIAENFGIGGQFEAPMFDRADEAEDALRRGAIELISGSAAELFAIDPALLAPPFLAATHSGRVGDEYLLLVHEQSTMRQFSDLGGCRLAVLDSPTGLLGRPWLEVLCASAGFPPAERFFGEIRSVPKPSQAVLPVFFQQCDACIVPRASLATLAELNPQVERRLRIVATSPRVAPILTAVRNDLPPPFQARLIEAIVSVDTLPVGRQVLTLFQTESVRTADAGTIAATRALLAAHRRLVADRINAASAPTK